MAFTPFQLLCLALVSSLCINVLARDNHTEDLNLSMSGDIVDKDTWTSTFSLNRSRVDMFSNWSLQLNYDNTGEGPNKRIRMKGKFLGNSTAPVLAKVFSHASNGDDCYDEVGDRTKLEIVSRKEWNSSEPQTTPKSRPKPADYVIVDGARYTNPGNPDGASLMKKLQMSEAQFHPNLLRNFFVMNDGVVYEGLGWDHYTDLNNGGLGKFALFISLVNLPQQDGRLQLPSDTAVRALKSLVRTAVCTGKLSNNYKLVPYYLIYEPFLIPDGSFEKGELKNWDHFEDKIKLDGEDGHHPIVFREELDWTKSLKGLDPLPLPVKYVIVSSYYYRCFTTEGCLNLMNHIPNVDKVFLNFFVGDDGRAYEVRGWDYSPSETARRISAVEVAFFGRHHSYPPSRRALLAFNSLLRLGVLWGKLSPEYKVLTVRQVPRHPGYVDEKLVEEVESMERYLKGLRVVRSLATGGSECADQLDSTTSLSFL